MLRRRPEPRVWILVAAALAAFGAVLAMHGLAPGQSELPLIYHFHIGAVDCLHNEGWRGLDGDCSSLSKPTGLRFFTNGALFYTANLISWLPLVSNELAVWITHVLVDAGGFGGVYLLARRMGTMRGIAIAASFGFLAGPGLVYTNGILATFPAFVLMPLAIYALLRAFDALADRREVGLRLALGLAAMVVLVFIEGYAYVATSFFLGCYLLVWLFKQRRSLRTRIEAVATLGTSVGLPILIYTAYVPSGAYEARTPMTVYRAMGADIVTWFVPQRWVWWAKATGWNRSYAMGWGDESAYKGNYLGYVLLALALFVVLKAGRRSWPMFLAAMTAITLFFSLGPALKVNALNQRDLSKVPYDYFMPAERATVELPTKLLYEHAPGFDNMRATYRWNLLAALCLVLLGALALDRIWRSNRKALAVGLALLAFAEVSAPIPDVLNQNRENLLTINDWKAGPRSEFPTLVRPGERVLLLPSENDFLANELGPVAKVNLFNAGPDKAMFYAHSNWPKPLLEANEQFYKEGVVPAVEAVLNGEADAVVIPYFDLLKGALVWPPERGLWDAHLHIVEYLERTGRFQVTRGEWFAVFRLPLAG